MLKEALILDDVEMDMLSEMYHLKCLTSALIFDDQGTQSQGFFLEYGKMKFPWVYKDSPERKKTPAKSSIPGLSPQEAAEAERMIQMVREMQKQQKAEQT
jgi:hypothetical protein